MGTEINRDIIVYFDNQFVPLREARVGILTHALHYGTGAGRLPAYRKWVLPVYHPVAAAPAA